MVDANSGMDTLLGVSWLIGSLQNRVGNDPLFGRCAGTYNGVNNSRIYQVGAGGISIGGGDRAMLTPVHNFVENYRIYDFNRMAASYRK